MGKDHTIYALEEGVVKFERSATRARVRWRTTPQARGLF